MLIGFATNSVLGCSLIQSYSFQEEDKVYDKHLNRLVVRNLDDPRYKRGPDTYDG